MTTHRILTFATLKKSEKKKILQLRDEYGFNISAIVIHVAHYIACRKLKGKDIRSSDSNNSAIARYALDLYRPFSLSIKNAEELSFSYLANYSRESLYSQLKQVGILEPCLLFAAIVRTVIKYPYEASRIRVLGIYSAKHCCISQVKRLSNSKVNTTLNLPVEVYDTFKDIAQRNNSNMRSMIRDVVKSVCSIEFRNGSFTENHKVFKKLILKPARIVEQNMHGQYGRITVAISDLRLSVQLKAVIEKYGIPSIRDFFKRIVYFIISVHSGDVKFTTVRIEDNDDYNETRMVRDAYRKELIYGTR